MALLKAYIPESNFAEGGKFYKYADNKMGVQVPLVGAHPIINVTSQPKFFEESQYHPNNSTKYSSDLQAIRNGLIVIEKDGVAQTPEQLIEIFKAFYQEL